MIEFDSQIRSNKKEKYLYLMILFYFMATFSQAQSFFVLILYSIIIEPFVELVKLCELKELSLNSQDRIKQ